jgi:cytoskeletal protein RodZ
VKNIGDVLKNARDEKGYTIEDAARETNIAKKYLTALEAEDFEQFPAEAYVLGFLKNYADFLGLDVGMLLDRYRVLKIQEQPVPMKELLHKSSNLPHILITSVIVAVAILLVGGAAFFIINLLSKRPAVETAIREPVEYTLNEGELEQRFFTGDSIVIPAGETLYKIELKNFGEAITLSTPDGDKFLDLNQGAQFDVNTDGFPELIVTVADYAENNPEMGAYLNFELNGRDSLLVEGATPVEANSDEVAVAAVAAQTGGGYVVWTSNNPYPFTLQLNFQGYCMLRWEILREANNRPARNERYCVRGEELSIQAQNGVRLWISNAGSVKIQAIGGGHTVSVKAGEAGEVVVTDIFWQRGEDGKYNLVQAQLES